jgi:hypothetical protein
MDPITEDLCLKVREMYLDKLGGSSYDQVPEIGNVNNEGVCTYAIDLGMPDLIINSYASKSPLSNYALGSAEVAKNDKGDTQYLNLFEIMIPDDPNWEDNLSRGQVYIAYLDKKGINASIAHFHWWGMTPFMAAIHSQNIGMHPVKFAKNIAKALKKVNMTFM